MAVGKVKMWPKPMAELALKLAVPFDVVEVEGVGEAIHEAVVAGNFAELAVAAILGAGREANPVGFKEDRVFLLADVLRQEAGTDRAEEVRKEQIVEPNGS